MFCLGFVRLIIHLKGLPRAFWGYPVPVAKQLTRETAERKRLQAAAFMERLGEPDRAAQFRDMSTDEYVEHKGLRLTNPILRRRIAMAVATGTRRADLQDQIDRAIETLDDAYAPESTREELAQAVGEALDILRGEDEEAEEQDDDLDDDEDDDSQE